MNDLTELDDSPASPPVPADELISRHFDGPLPPEDHERLTRLLHDDPQALLDFVATARLHQALENRAAVPRPGAASGKRKRPLRWFVGVSIGAAAAAALVAGGGWMIFGTSQGGAGQRSGVVVTVSDIPPPPPEQLAKAEAPGLKKRIVKVAGAAAAGQEQPDLEELLGRYYVDVTPHGLTVPQALRQLDQAVREVNILNRPGMNQLRYEIGASVEPEAEDPVVLTPLVPPMTVKTYLETCGLFRKVTRQPGNVVYGRDPWPPVNSAQLVTKIWPVPPDFLSSMPKKLLNVNLASAVATVPGQTSKAEQPKWTAWEGVNEFFLKPLEEGSTAVFSAGSSKLVVRSSLASLRLFEERLNSYLAPKAISQIFITSRICTMPRTALPAGFDEKSGLIMSDAEFQICMRTLSQTSEANLFTSPSVIARAGQRSLVEIAKEVPPSNTQEKWEDMGLFIDIQAQLRSELIQLEGKVRLGVRENKVIDESEPAYKLNMALPEPLASDGKVHSFTTEYELWIPDGQTALITLDVPLDHNWVAVLFITPTQIDPQGNLLHPRSVSDISANGDGIPLGIPVADKPGFVMSPYQANGMVDVTGIPPGTKVLCPFSRKQFRLP